MNNELRKRVRLLKALQGVSYKEIAYYLEITTNSLYNWLRGQYDLSPERQDDLNDILNNLSE